MANKAEWMTPPIPVVSTSNISKKDWDFLESIYLHHMHDAQRGNSPRILIDDDGSIIPNIGIADYGEGFFIWLSGEDLAELKGKLSKSFFECFNRHYSSEEQAKEGKNLYIRFDSDGDILDGVQEHSW